MIRPVWKRRRDEMLHSIPGVNARRAGALLLCCAAGCTNAKFAQKEMFAAYAPGGKATYYRVFADGYGWNGKVDYNSGWFPAKDVDKLFGRVSEQHDVEAATAVRQRRAIRDTFDNYMSALTDPTKTDADIEAAKKRYQAAMAGISGLTSAGGDPKSALDHADEKFVMVFSSDPDKIIEAIKAKVQEGKFTRAVGTLLSQQQKAKSAETSLRLSRLEDNAKSLTAALEAANTGLTTTNLKTQLLQLLSQVEAVQ